MVLKPSEVTPVNAYLLTEAIHAAGLALGMDVQLSNNNAGHATDETA